MKKFYSKLSGNFSRSLYELKDLVKFTISDILDRTGEVVFKETDDEVYVMGYSAHTGESYSYKVSRVYKDENGEVILECKDDDTTLSLTDLTIDDTDYLLSMMVTYMNE